MIWRFPLLPTPAFFGEAEATSAVISFGLCFFLVAAGLYGLWRTARSNYNRVFATRSFEVLGIALIVAIFGFGNLFLIAVAGLLLWFVVWRGLIYWLLWRMIIRSFFAMIFGPPSNPQ